MRPGLRFFFIPPWERLAVFAPLTPGDFVVRSILTKWNEERNFSQAWCVVMAGRRGGIGWRWGQWLGAGVNTTSRGVQTLAFLFMRACLSLPTVGWRLTALTLWRSFFVPS